MNQPLVSVIIPNYNHARYLDQRIQSVLNQTYRNIEVIILDDCSTDNSIAVINKYKSDSRIKHIIVNEHNSGNTFLQWDKGLHLATGELVWIAESDDYCRLDLLEKLVSFFQSNRNTVLAYCTPLCINNEGMTWEFSREGNNQRVTSRSYLRRYLLNMNWPFNASCCLFRKKEALKNAHQYKAIDAAGDYMFWSELLSTGGNVAIVNKHLSIWRMHDDSVTSPLMRNGKIAINEKKIFDYICLKVHIGHFRSRHAMRYHQKRFSGFGITSDVISYEINDIWGFDSVKTIRFGDKVFRILNYLFKKWFNYPLSVEL